MAAPKNLPWKQIRTEYITKRVSYRNLVEKYDVSLTTLSKRAKAEEWTKKRKEYEEKELQKTIQKTLEKQAEKRSDELVAAEEACAGIIGIAASIIADPGQFTRHLVKLRQGHGEGVYKEELIEENKSIIDARRLKDIATALETATRLSRILKGIMDEPVRQKLDIERKKLEIDRTKVEQKQPTDDINITMEGELEDWSV